MVTYNITEISFIVTYISTELSHISYNFRVPYRPKVTYSLTVTYSHRGNL